MVLLTCCIVLRNQDSWLLAHICIDQLLIVTYRCSLLIMLGLVDIDASVSLIVESARNRLNMRRTLLLFFRFQVQVFLQQIFVKKTSGTCLTDIRSLKWLQRSFDNIRNLHLKWILEIHEFGRDKMVNFSLKGLFTDQNLCVSIMRHCLLIIIWMHARVLFWILIFVVALIFINSLELLSEHFNFCLQLNVIISELKKLIHHSTTLLLSLLSAFSSTLPVFKLPVILFR